LSVPIYPLQKPGMSGFQHEKTLTLEPVLLGDTPDAN